MIMIYWIFKDDFIFKRSCHQYSFGSKIWGVCIWMDIKLLFSPWVCCKSAEIDAEVLFPFPHRQTPIINGKCDAIRICVYGLLDIWLSTTTSPLVLLAQIPQQPQQPLLIALVHWEYQYTSQAGLRTKNK